MLYITPQIMTVPSIRWDVLQAPTLATPTARYEGHLPNSGVQRHSADDAYAAHGIVMEAHQGRRLVWYAKKNGKVIAAHPRHDAARFMALAILTGA